MRSTALKIDQSFKWRVRGNKATDDTSACVINWLRGAQPTLEREIKRVPQGHAIVIPFSDETRGHGSHTVAALWKDELIKLLKESERN
jgi:hypothetical protein